MATTLDVLTVDSLAVAGLPNTCDGNCSLPGTLAVSGVTTLTGMLIANGGIKLPVQHMTANGAVTILSGLVILDKAGVLAATLADPTATTDDGKMLIVLSITAQAHTLTLVSGLNGAGAGADVGTFGAAVGNGVVLIAYGGYWYEVPAAKLNVTFG